MEYINDRGYMADDQNTPPTDPAGTEPAPSADPATQPPKDPAGASGDDKQVTLSEKDYKNLVSQRDRANNAAGATDAFVMELAKEREITNWHKENAKDYPDVTIEDLMAAESEEDLPKIAQRTQRRIEDAVQAKLLSTQRASAPSVSPEERDQKLKKLRGNDRPNDAFEQMVDLRMTPTK